ncbi:hypothetical protein BH20ACT5_BH20ACT5_10610 [soil metagenome]
MLAPFTLRLSERTEVIPDLAVIRSDIDPLPRYPRYVLLVVEVLSSSTRRRDVTLKKQVYADAGVPSYWVIDPDRPELVAYELAGGDYVEAGRVREEDTFAATAPFPVRVTPDRLVTR